MEFQNTSVRGFLNYGNRGQEGEEQKTSGVEKRRWGGGGMVKYTASMFNRETGGFLLLYKFI